MSKQKYDEASVLRSLARRKGININRSNKIIEINSNASDVGNGSWGKIDYLTNYCGWFARVDKTFIKKTSNEYIDNSEREVISKKIKRENKLNLAKQIKDSMKKIKK